MSLDSILDQTLEDLADAPSIELFPNGAHKVKLEFVIDDKKVAVQMKLEYVETVEQADPTEKSASPGDKNSVFFNLKNKDGVANEYAQGALKTVVTALKEGGFDGSSTREILTAAKGVECFVVTKIRKGKGEYEGRDSLDVVKLAVA